MFERTTDHDRVRQDSPQQSPSMHQTPFYVLPTLESNKLLTLPGGKLINGLRNAVTSHERNAIHIARSHNLAVKGRGILTLPDGPKNVGYGFVVEPAWKTAIPEYADFTTYTELDNHQHSLELHNHHALIEQLSDRPDRNNELAFIRAFGNFILSHRL
jgi:hypothetical protein